jgi:hypothetical protein
MGRAESSGGLGEVEPEPTGFEADQQNRCVSFLEPPNHGGTVTGSPVEIAVVDTLDVAAIAETLRLVAQYADSWNGAFRTVEEAAHKVDVLCRHCDAVGRDPNEVQKTAMMLVDPLTDLDGFLTLAGQYAALGFDLIDVMPPVDETDPAAFAGRLGEHVIPRLAQLSVVGDQPVATSAWSSAAPTPPPRC